MLVLACAVLSSIWHVLRPERDKSETWTCTFEHTSKASFELARESILEKYVSPTYMEPELAIFLADDGLLRSKAKVSITKQILISWRLKKFVVDDLDFYGLIQQPLRTTAIHHNEDSLAEVLDIQHQYASNSDVVLKKRAKTEQSPFFS